MHSDDNFVKKPAAKKGNMYSRKHESERLASIIDMRLKKLSQYTRDVNKDKQSEYCKLNEQRERNEREMRNKKELEEAIIRENQRGCDSIGSDNIYISHLNAMRAEKDDDKTTARDYALTIMEKDDHFKLLYEACMDFAKANKPKRVISLLYNCEFITTEKEDLKYILENFKLTTTVPEDLICCCLNYITNSTPYYHNQDHRVYREFLNNESTANVDTIVLDSLIVKYHLKETSVWSIFYILLLGGEYDIYWRDKAIFWFDLMKAFINEQAIYCFIHKLLLVDKLCNNSILNDYTRDIILSPARFIELLKRNTILRERERARTRDDTKVHTAVPRVKTFTYEGKTNTTSKGSYYLNKKGDTTKKSYKIVNGRYIDSSWDTCFGSLGRPATTKDGLDCLLLARKKEEKDGKPKTNNNNEESFIYLTMIIYPFFDNVKYDIYDLTELKMDEFEMVDCVIIRYKSPEDEMTTVVHKDDLNNLKKLPLQELDKSALERMKKKFSPITYSYISIKKVTNGCQVGQQMSSFFVKNGISYLYPMQKNLRTIQ